MNRIGIQLGARWIRAVKSSGWGTSRVETIEVSWDPEQPVEALAFLRERLGSARHVSVAIDLPLLRTKRLSLPPIPGEEKRKLLGMEPDRFFATRGGDLVFAVSGGDDLVFAVPEELAMVWREGLKEVGPLESMEPSPRAVMRAFRKSGLDTAVVLLDHQDGSLGLLDIHKGALRQSRRLFRGIDALPEALERLESSDSEGAGAGEGEGDAGGSPVRTVFLHPWDDVRARELVEKTGSLEVIPAPDPGGAGSEFLVAYGTLLGGGDAWRESFLTPEIEGRLQGRRHIRLGVATVAFVVALVFAGQSLDRSRERALSRLDTRISSLQERASRALDLQARARALGAEMTALDSIQAHRPDPLTGILRLTERLPEEAWIRSLQTTGADLEINGWARNAAALIPILENDPHFRDVRFLSGTSRTQMDGETYDLFALALRVSGPS